MLRKETTAAVSFGLLALLAIEQIWADSINMIVPLRLFIGWPLFYLALSFGVNAVDRVFDTRRD